MPKDKSGRFHPGKGRPSGKGKTSEIAGRYDVDSDIALEEKYVIDADTNKVEGVSVRHPNRNPEKKNDRKTTESVKAHAQKSVRNVTGNGSVNTDAEEIKGGLSKLAIQELASVSGDVCITFYIPTFRTGKELNEQVNQITFKSALQQVANELKDRMSQDEIAKLLSPGYRLIKNDSFWNNQAGGLAVFITDNHFRYMKLHSAPQQQIWINRSFLLKPLIPFSIIPEYFYLLVISKKQSKLFRADNFGVQFIPLSELPRGIDDVVHFEEKDDQKLFRSGSSGAGGGANYHGIGAGKPDEKENISMYLAEVDKTLWKEVLNREKVPLVLAGVDYMVAIYKRIAQYKYIWNESLTGSLEYENELSLYAEARKLVDSYFQQRTNQALENYGNHSAKETTSSIPADIIPAAFYSRVAHLFVQHNAKLWGLFDKDSEQLTVHEEQEAEDEDLIDKTIIETILHGGDVHMLPRERMPADSKIAALMRY